MTKTGTENLGDTSLAAEPIYLSDLDACRPATSFSPDTRRGYWRPLRYETDELSGVMLVAGTETAAPEVTYPLRLSGWHAVSLGLWGGERVLVRLTGEDTFTSIDLPVHDPRREPLDRYSVFWDGRLTPYHSGYAHEAIWEIFWKVVDLTGLEIVLGQETWRVAPGEGPYSHQSLAAMPAYIKVVPLSDAELDEHQADLRRTDTRCLFAHSDPGWFGQRPTTADELRRNSHMELYRGSDYSRIYLEAARGDRAFYLSEIGSVHPYASGDNYDSTGARLTDEGWGILREKGIDPFRVVVDHAHEVGLEVHAGLTMGGFNYPPPGDKIDRGRSFFKNHPELHGTARDGKPSSRLAYTYPEARRFVLSLLREIAAYPVEGIALLYNRKFPYVEYEPPLVEGFMAEFGEDPREIDERDARWLKYRSRILTQFMREVRQAMDEVAQETDRTNRIGVSAIVGNGRDENMYYGMDMDAWVKEGLVDTLIPYTSHPRFSYLDPSWEDAGDAEYWVSLTKGTSTVLALSIRPSALSAEESRRRVAPLYKAGVEHFFYWDGGMPAAMTKGASHVMRRLGHKEEIAAWVEASEPSLEAPLMFVRKLGDWDFTYMTVG